VARELTSLVEIDFLPESYRQRSMHRRAYWWRIAAAACIVGFFSLTSLWQQRQFANAQAKLADVETKYAEAAGKNANLAQLSATLEAERKLAELLTFLRHRWPRTQILAAIVEPLPDTVVLAEFQLGSEEAQGNQPPAIALSEAKTPPPTRSARQANDLSQLLHESARQRHWVALVGTADDAAILHAYLAQLGTNQLFERVDLQSLESLTKDPGVKGAAATMRFTARAYLRPGHGEEVPLPTSPADASAQTPRPGKGA
jgi:hypothetical protein